MKIALDFDGTCVYNEYPLIGDPIPKCVESLKQLIKDGHKLILNTMRSDYELELAVNWFKRNGIELYGIQQDPKQSHWTNSPKCHADISIDDRNIGCPLINDKSKSSKPFINWDEVMKLVEDYEPWVMYEYD